MSKILLSARTCKWRNHLSSTLWARSQSHGLNPIMRSFCVHEEKTECKITSPCHWSSILPGSHLVSLDFQIHYRTLHIIFLYNHLNCILLIISSSSFLIWGNLFYPFCPNLCLPDIHLLAFTKNKLLF